MRLTVGPLPPAVYWRRRAIVLGSLLVVIFFLVLRCGGSDASGDGGRQAGATSTVSPTPAVSTGARTPVVDPPASATPTAAGQQPTGPCTDSEISVTAVTENNKTEFIVGTYAKIFLKIKNVSNRSCARDVGGGPQELRIMQGAVKVWSSDDCPTGGDGGSDVRTLRPGELLDQFSVSWNGRASTNCATKPMPAPGTYQLTGRLGTKWSDPVTLIIKAAAK